MKKIRIGLFFGGRSGEHEVSLMSARSVINALDADRYEVFEIGITEQGAWRSGTGALESFENGDLSGLEPVLIMPEPGPFILYRRAAGDTLEPVTELDIAFPVLHGSFGEDGTLQGMFELAELAYVGAGVLASAVAMDKALFKHVMRANALPVLDWTVLTDIEYAGGFEAALARVEGVGSYPLFTKPANMGSSVGITRCENRSDLLEGIQDSLQYDRRVVIEQGIEAREIEVSVLGNEQPEASVAGEVVPGDIFYSYRAKYIDDTSTLMIPAALDAQTANEARRIAIEAYKLIDGAGMARVDFLLEKATGKLFLNEINTIPGFTKISMYPKLWEESGLAYPALLDRLIDLAQTRHRQRSGLKRSYGDVL